MGKGTANASLPLGRKPQKCSKRWSLAFPGRASSFRDQTGHWLPNLHLILPVC
jgi:hypothetical protein